MIIHIFRTNKVSIVLVCSVIKCILVPKACLNLPNLQFMPNLCIAVCAKLLNQNAEKNPK